MQNNLKKKPLELKPIAGRSGQVNALSSGSCSKNSNQQLNGFTVIKPNPAIRAKTLSIANAEEKSRSSGLQKAKSVKSIREINRLGGSRTNLNVNVAREKFLKNVENGQS